jgi:hypothetical protein
MHDTVTTLPASETIDLSQVERTLRASIALMRRSRRQMRRDPRPEAAPPADAYRASAEG